MKKLFILLAFAITTVSCNKENNKNYDSENEAEIQKYLKDNNITAELTDSGLYYVIDSLGNGVHPKANSDVIVDYKGSFTNGKTFGETNEHGAGFNLRGVIRGMAEGITLFKEGGEGTLIMPSRLAYGNHSVGSIPAGSVLVFDVKLISTRESGRMDSINNKQILKYLNDKNLVAKETESKLHYIINKQGDGKIPNDNSNVKVKYKGYYLDGEVFDETKDKAAEFNLQNVIPGFKEGLTKFNEGGKGTIIMPSKLGYGFFGRTPIPPGTVIAFDVELIKVY